MKTGGEPINISTVTEGAELARVAELAGRIWRAHYPGIISPEQIQYMLERMYAIETIGAEIRSQGIRYYQILADGQMAGFASLGPTTEPGVAKLHKLYVVPEVHGRGLGKRLLNHCETEMVQIGARRLILAVNKRNAKAIAFYQRNGFAVIESVVNDIGGGYVMDDFIMAKELAT
jgi:ribosomal protein S18 acetylase RimI-like enzyme